MLNLNPEDLQVTSFQTAPVSDSISTGGQSWPDVCTCIGICQPSADIYCSGGCPPETTMPVEQTVAY
ncbi:hypothetical protein [Longimicrobium sp.]|uniref:hypothetical protein n=1 Tax=Longimicrobium sp. TaxID=2029185 RepID=UPI002B6A8C6C|nr:hypothetical protein [Longimicrobium sp.]HSU17897.1 hypothetical protein [Longimicrobium sp.]